MSDNSEPNESMIDKITKLLEKANSTQFEDEADAFRAKAHELMMRHAIDEAMLSQHRKNGDDKVVKRAFEYRGQFASAHAHLCFCVGQAFGFELVSMRGDKASTERPVWVGFESDVKVAEVVLASLLIQVTNDLAKFTRKMQSDYPHYTTRDLYKHRRSFVYGFADKICRRLIDARRVVTEEVDAESDGGASLAVLARSELIKAEFHTMFPHLRAGRASNREHSLAGMHAGRESGSRADIGSPRVGGQKALGSG